MAPFKIGINMAGAISAGAYTAGVLDFLTEALDEWYKAKASGEAVPSHDVSIEVFSGASAGGMCAAISALLLQEDFEHIHDTSKRGTNNRFYESWVNQIDITGLLKTDDLKPSEPVCSLLNSNIIQQIANYALTPAASLPPPRPYVSPDLTLYLSLTNLRGTPYSLNAAAPGSIEETTFYYADRICFRTTRTSAPPMQDRHIRTIDLTQPGAAGGWDALQTAAMATGAFPVFLLPRVLQRYKSEYCPPDWEPVTGPRPGDPPPIPPNFPPTFQEPFPTLNVDGGVTNNDPFNYSHDYLASLSPASPDGKNLRGPTEADRAVINIAPFPTTDPFDSDYNPEKSASLFSAFSRLVSAVISQSRFFGESLSEIMTGVTFSRFIIAPSDPELTAEHLRAGGKPEDQPPALQCASLGAFGGFFHRDFRAHDYALGRRNCQKFLNDSFVLPADNPIMKTALDALTPEARQIVEDKFRRRAPGTYAEPPGAQPLPKIQQNADDLWLPIIPLCTESLATPLPRIPRAKMTCAQLDSIVTLIIDRYKALIPHLIDLIPSMWFRRFLNLGQFAIRRLARGPIKEALKKGLGDSYQG
jgi:Patatin-like phospholipase